MDVSVALGVQKHATITKLVERRTGNSRRINHACFRSIFKDLESGGSFGLRQIPDTDAVNICSEKVLFVDVQ